MAEFLSPVLALIFWTFIIWAIMYWRRIPAMNKIHRNPQKFIDDPNLWQKMPKSATNAADNYNHLHEQPVLFYALMFFLALTGMTDTVNLYLAWGYVALRVAHSLVQITTNTVLWRFGFFTIASFFLFVLGVRALFNILGV